MGLPEIISAFTGFFDWLRSHNLEKAKELAPLYDDYVNDIDVIASLDNFVSINTVLQVDLWGQISAESIGTKHHSSIGAISSLMAYKMY